MSKSKNPELERVSDPREIINRLTRPVVMEVVGVSTQSISNAIADGCKLPGWWFGTLEPIAAAAGFEMATSAFSWKKADAA